MLSLSAGIIFLTSNPSGVLQHPTEAQIRIVSVLLQ